MPADRSSFCLKLDRRADHLFSDIQRLFEQTYATVGVNLEDCLIDRHRCGQLSRLAGATARELSDLARTFLRRVGDRSDDRYLLLALAHRAAREKRSPPRI